MATSIASTIHNRYVTVYTAAAETDLSPWTWRRWAYEGKISSVKVGTRLLIPREEVERLMAEGLRPARRAQPA
ncbi:MAG: helix-turn-helix domain-containing protein [Bryobacteraceae bacterium]